MFFRDDSKGVVSEVVCVQVTYDHEAALGLLAPLARVVHQAESGEDVDRLGRRVGDGLLAVVTRRRLLFVPVAPEPGGGGERLLQCVRRVLRPLLVLVVVVQHVLLALRAVRIPPYNQYIVVSKRDRSRAAAGGWPG